VRSTRHFLKIRNLNTRDGAITTPRPPGERHTKGLPCVNSSSTTSECHGPSARIPKSVNCKRGASTNKEDAEIERARQRDLIFSHHILRTKIPREDKRGAVYYSAFIRDSPASSTAYNDIEGYSTALWYEADRT
jgi:hypothetical protein